MFPVELEISFYGRKPKDFYGLSTVYQIQPARCVGITTTCIEIDMKKFIAYRKSFRVAAGGRMQGRAKCIFLTKICDSCAQKFKVIEIK